MTARRLSAEEAQAWGRVMASVRPLKPVPVATTVPAVDRAPRVPPPSPPRASPKTDGTATTRAMAGDPVARPAVAIGPGSLDGGWDRRLSRGLVAPDSTVDLHGHTLASAHAALDRGIDRALVHGDRVLLLVTGKPPRAESERPHARGAIRAAVVDWLAASRHADAIAAVRGAHPRHGGQGALYLVLRRPRAR